MTPPDTTEIKAEELMEGSEYEFRIVACNKAGQSEPSAPSRTIVAKNPFGMLEEIFKTEKENETLLFR